MNSIRDLFGYKLLATIIHKCSVKLNPENEMRRAYYKAFHRYPDLANPHNLIEKIFWMQLHSDTSMWTMCADKYSMREYVKECGYEDFLPQNYGKWDKAEDIDFDALPKGFVLKTNNGCGTVMVVKDKNKLDTKKVKKKLKQWLYIPFGYSGAELHYTRIKPCIIAEELLSQDEDQKLFSPGSMVDYKVWCINGETQSILVVFDRQKDGYCLDLYDTEWNRMSDKLKNNGHFRFCEMKLPKPKCLDKMLLIAQGISKRFPEVRVDFYVVANKPIIGELTFTTGYGYFTDEYYDYLGHKLKLPNRIR